MKRYCLVLMIASVAVGQTAKPRLATLAQQKTCAVEARRVFNESYSTDADNGLTYKYTSHYDPEANVCYILVQGVGVFKDGVPGESELVFDAIEGRTYAAYTWINSQNKKFWEVTPMQCNVHPRGQDAITCKSSDEFDSLIDKYFGIGR